MGGSPAGRVQRRLVSLLPPAVAVAAGALWATSFGARPLLVAPALALVPLCLMLGLRRAPGLAFLHGFSFWLASIPWIAPTVSGYGGLPEWLGWLVLLILAGYLAAFDLLFGWAGARIWRHGGVATPALLACLWVALEWLRAHWFSGFPWNLAAYAWVELPGARELTPWLGSYGVSGLLVAVNAGVARGILLRSAFRMAVWPALAALLLAGAALWSPSPPVEVGPEAGEVRIVQPATEIAVSYDPERARRDYQLLLRLSQRACESTPALLVWPESAAWPFSYQRDAFLRRDLERLAAAGCPVLFNSPHWQGERVFNSVLLVTGPEAPQRSDKLHLVPFGEYVPRFATLLPGIGKLARNVGDFSPGERVRPLEWGRERLGLSICYEVIFPGETAAAVRRGATVLATLTNDGWYGDTAAPWQHFRAARFRAAENRRPLFRAALTGVSGFIAEDGSVRSRLGVGERGALGGWVAGRSELTPFSRAPWLVPLLCSLSAGFAIFRGSRRSAE